MSGVPPAPGTLLGPFPFRPLLEYPSSVLGPHPNTLVNKIEMAQRRAVCCCHDDYKTIEKGCMSEMIGKLN